MTYVHEATCSLKVLGKDKTNQSQAYKAQKENISNLKSNYSETGLSYTIVHTLGLNFTLYITTDVAEYFVQVVKGERLQELIQWFC